MDKEYLRKGGVNLKITCHVVLDLIPLVKDGVASSDSVKIVEEHIEDCECCREEFETFESTSIEDSNVKDEKIIFDIKRSIFITQIIILLVGAIGGIAMTNTMGMFYNFLIMPVIGGLGYFRFKEKWKMVPIAVFALSYLWQLSTMIIQGGLFVEEVFLGVALKALYYPVYFSSIYTFLVLLGVVIGKLLYFAFGKEKYVQ